MTNYVEDASPDKAGVFGNYFTAHKADPPAPLHWRTYKLPKEDPDVLLYGDGVIGWELKIDDVRAGLVQRGDFARGANQYDGDYRATSTSTGVDPRWRRHLLLSHLKKGTTFGTAPSSAIGASVNYGGTLVMGYGATANFAIYKETSGIDATPVAVTYTPTGAIISLSTGLIGATNTERMFVGTQGTAAQVHDTIGTSAATMHANTASMYGMLMSPVNAATPGAQTLLMYCLHTMYTLSSASATGTAPTAVLTGLPSGGYAVGIEQVAKNWPVRAYWVMPLRSPASDNPMLFDLAAGYATPTVVAEGGRIYSTNLEGTDYQPVKLPLTRVYFADLWQRQIVATDGSRIIAWDGDSSRDLDIFRNRVGNSDTGYRVVGLGANDADLYAVVQVQDYVTVGNSILELWLYVEEFDSWLKVSSSWAAETGAVGSNATTVSPYVYTARVSSYASRLPISKSTSFAHVNMTGVVWNRQFLPPPGQNSYYLYRQTGTSAEEAQEFETTGTWDSPYFSLPTLDGRQKKADQVVFGGEVSQGSVQVTINPNQGGSTLTFAGTDVTQAQDVESSDATFDQLQIRIKLNQGASTRRTPNGLPITVRGRAYLTNPLEELTGDYI